MVGRLYGMKRTRGQGALGRAAGAFDLADAAERVVKEYSGGMRRRLDLAAALVAKPPVLFLDEPTTGLDPRSRLDLWEMIEELIGGGTTVLLTTQYLDEADRLADDIAVIDNGKVIAQGTPAELKQRVGGERLEVRLADPAQAPQAAQALAPLSDEAAVTEGDHVTLAVAPAQRHDRRGRTAAGRRRRGRRRHRPAHADHGRRVPVAHRAGRRTEDERRARRRRHEATGHRHPDHRGAQPDAAAAPARPVHRVHDPADHVRAAVRVRVRRRDQARPGYDYKDFLIPGIIVQNIAFGGFITAMGLAEDLNKGLIDRFRSLPMSRAALLAGRTLSDVVTNLVSMTILIVTGLIIGFSFGAGVGDIVSGVLLMVLFGYAFSWVFAFLGMLVSTPEAANSLGFMLVFPLTFISSAFVPVDSMPDGAEGGSPR